MGYLDLIKYIYICAYKINAQILIAFFDTISEHMDTKINNIMPFIITQKKRRGINITKHTQNLYSEKCKIMKEIKDFNKWSDMLHSRIGRFNIKKCQFLQIYFQI